MRRKMAAGNWKMNGTAPALSILTELANAHDATGPDIVICPPATLLSQAADLAKGTSVSIGAQDCHAQISGAFTGDLSAEMIAEAGGSSIIIGHSERRTAYGESNADVRAKATAVFRAGLTAILCIGESLQTRNDGNTLTVIETQLAGSLPDQVTGQSLVIAYEPIWAIGTGMVPTLAQIIEVHDFIRAHIIRRYGPRIGDQISLLYGGSVKPGNAAEIFTAENVDGALVGGASLKAADFSPIIAALAAS
ncbi:MAG: triose-phosphate isomerase [Sulfitobacter sp.]